MSENKLLEEAVELQECVRRFQKELDRFNLMVAEERVKTGLTPQIVDLYKRMGSLSQFLTREMVATEICQKDVQDLTACWVRRYLQ